MNKCFKKRLVLTMVGVIALASLSVHAFSPEEVNTKLVGYWVQPNGDLVFYGSIGGPCVSDGKDSTIYLVRKALLNFDQLSIALNIAMAKNYSVTLVVENCDANQNVVTYAKICKTATLCGG